MPRSMWRTDLDHLTAIERRLARYALQLIQDAPDFKKTRLQERDILGALWPLLRSIIEPRALAVLVTRPKEAHALDDELGLDWDDDDLALSDRRLRERLRRGFESIPRTLLKRLAKAEADETLSPTVALLVEQLALDATTQRVLEFLDLYTLSEPLRQLLRACGTAAGRVNLPRLAALLGLPAPPSSARRPCVPWAWCAMTLINPIWRISCARASCCASCSTVHPPMAPNCWPS